MTTAEIRSLARQYARMSTAGATNTAVDSLITLGQTQFARDVHGFPADDFLAIQAKFDMDTNMAFRLTIDGSTNNDIAATDIAVTSTDYDDKSGASAAAILQTQIRTAIGTGADATVTWTDFYFTVSPIQTTATISIESPSADTYSDATERFFGGEQDETGPITCGFPQDCTMYADLPSDFGSLTFLSWDGIELIPLPRRLTAVPESSGTPVYYSIVGKRLYLSPVPTEQKELYIEYKKIPTADVGTNIDTAIPEEFQPAIAYWVASELLKQTFEEQQSTARRKDYEKIRAQYMSQYHNAATEVDTQQRHPYPWYRVQT